jgi:hypothetical protein
MDGGQLMRRAAFAALTAVSILLAAGCGQSYDDKIEACTKAVRAHDFEAFPLDEGDRLSACKGLKEEDVNAILFHNAMDDLGWLDDEGNFDKNKMLESTP